MTQHYQQRNFKSIPEIDNEESIIIFKDEHGELVLVKPIKKQKI